ncbi:MAG: class I SAM-dependent methyltransferase [Bacteroidota bacterium]
MEMNSSACPVCGYHQFKVAFATKDYFFTGKDFTVNACIKCGMLMTAGLHPGKDLSVYYKSEQYISHSDTRKGIVNRIYHLVRNIMLRRKHRMVCSVSGLKTGSILDIGTGTGYFPAFMKSKGWQATGTEKSEEARKYASEKQDILVYDEEKLFSLPAASYDVVTLWHVMEHLPNINQHWQVISKILKPDGVLIIALPNVKSWDARHYGPYWAAWDVPRHIWHFSPKHVKELGKKEGFRLSRTMRMPFDAFYISIMSEKYKQSSFPVLKGMFYGKLSWFASLYNKKRCSSLIYVFRKIS